jgi:hypothetical protein
MRKVYLPLLVFLLIVSCHRPGQGTAVLSGHETSSQSQHQNTLAPTGNYGEVISDENAIPAENLPDLFKESDSLQVKLSGKIRESCQHTGCWMNLDMGNDQVVYVTFRDEAFVIPLDAAGKKAIADGWAYRKKVSAEELRNDARDEGKPEEEIARIMMPGYEYSFVARGVLFK